MAVYHDGQTSFAHGEIDPELHGRVDLAIYKSSCKTLRNFLPSLRGPAYNRPGTHFIADTKTDSTVSRLVSFVPSSDTAFVLEFGDGYIRFYLNGAQVLSGGIPYEVATPYAAADVFDLKFTRSADTLYIVHKDYAPRTLQRIADDNWTLVLYAFVNGPFMLPNSDSSNQMTIGFDIFGVVMQSASAFFDSGHVGAYISMDIPYASSNYIDDVTGTQLQVLGCGGTWRLTTTGTWSGTITISVWDGSVYNSVRTFKGNNDLNIDTFGTVDLIDGYIPSSVKVQLAITSGTCHTNFASDAYIATYIFKISTVTNSTHAKATFDSRYQTPQYGSYTIWAEGSWSTYRGWPRAVNFFQDRLAFAATETEPQNVWFTKTSNYVDFGRSFPLVDSDGITISLQSRQVNPILTIASSLNTCLVFTGFSYWSLTSDSGGAITPTTVSSKYQEERGINAVDPITIGNRLLFIDGRGSTVRDVEYQYLSDRYQSENISIEHAHLFRDYTIVDMAYQQTPESIVWMVRSDGVLVSLTYLREQEVLGYARHDTYDGAHTFESVCTIPGVGVDEVWVIVNRNSHRYIERMLLRTSSTDPADQYFVDCGLTYAGAAVSSLSGFTHLNGLLVAINANGFVQPQQTVGGGVVSVPAGTTKAVVGLPYKSDLEMLNPEIPMQDGAFQGRKYQTNRATFRFLNTVGGYVGPDLDTLDPINMRQNLFPSLSSSTPTPLYTGFDSYVIRPTDDSRGHIAFRQVDPMPVTILTVTPIVDPGQQP